MRGEENNDLKNTKDTGWSSCVGIVCANEYCICRGNK